MRILLTSATAMEQLPEQHFSGIALHRLVHGCGLLAAGVNLTTALLQTPFDLVIQIGIAGTYNAEIDIAETVVVRSEQLGDCGAELADGTHANLFDLNLEEANQLPYQSQQLINTHTGFFPAHLRVVNGLTVNLSTGTDATAQARKLQYHADIETMEGAALHYTCLKRNIPFLQLRSISNRVETRNKASWKIKESLASLHHELTLYLNTLRT